MSNLKTLTVAAALAVASIGAFAQDRKSVV